jgi:hypothetical protein
MRTWAHIVGFLVSLYGVLVALLGIAPTVLYLIGRRAPSSGDSGVDAMAMGMGFAWSVGFVGSGLLLLAAGAALHILAEILFHVRAGARATR